MRFALTVLLFAWFVTGYGVAQRAPGKDLPRPPAAAISRPQITPTHDYSVILISVDGLRPDAITVHGPSKVPAFYRFRREGAYTDNARTADDATVTLPNHVGMITSRLVTGPMGHGWTWNRDPPLGSNLHRNKGEYLESVFSVAHDHGLRTALYASKSKFSLFDLSYDEKNGRPDLTGYDNGRDKIDAFIQASISESVIDDLEDVMKRDRFHFLMVHIRTPDTAGHGFSWTTSQPSVYMSAVRKADELVEDIFEQVEKNPLWRGRTYLVLTADHGGLTGAKSHDLIHERENFTIPFYVWGPGVPAGADLYELNPITRRDPGILNPSATSSPPQTLTLLAEPVASASPPPPGRFDLPPVIVTPPPVALTFVPPIRNADAGNLCLSLLGLPPIPGSTVNVQQDLRVRSVGSPSP